MWGHLGRNGVCRFGTAPGSTGRLLHSPREHSLDNCYAPSPGHEGTGMSHSKTSSHKRLTPGFLVAEAVCCPEGATAGSGGTPRKAAQERGLNSGNQKTGTLQL